LGGAICLCLYWRSGIFNKNCGKLFSECSKSCNIRTPLLKVRIHVMRLLDNFFLALDHWKLMEVWSSSFMRNSAQALDAEWCFRQIHFVFEKIVFWSRLLERNCVCELTSLLMSCLRAGLYMIWNNDLWDFSLIPCAAAAAFNVKTAEPVHSTNSERFLKWKDWLKLLIYFSTCGSVWLYWVMYRSGSIFWNCFGTAFVFYLQVFPQVLALERLRFIAVRSAH